MNSTLIEKKNILRNDFKLNYEELKETYTQFKNYIDEQKQNGKEISNSDKYNLLFSKSRVALTAGLYNDDKALFEKSFKQFKKYGLELLESLADDDVGVNIQISKNARDGEIFTGTAGKHIKSEAYRQFAIFLKKKNEFYESLSYYWFLEIPK